MRKPLLCRFSTACWLLTVLYCTLAVTTPATAATDPAEEALIAIRQAQARKAAAEAERAELLARLPPATAKPLEGTADVGHFGSAGLVRAFDLANELSVQLCAALPADRTTALYEPGTAQAMVAARTVSEGISRLTEDLGRQNKALQAFIEEHTPPGSKAAALPIVALAVVPATVRAAADIAALWKTDLTAKGIGYGEGARSLFAAALAQRCPERIAGLGAGYLGELDAAQHDKLLARLRALAAQRAEYARRIEVVERLADGARGDEKKDLVAMADSAGALLKQADEFIASLRAGEAGDRSPFFNAVRYLGYASRTAGALVLEYDLRLEGLAIVKDGLFSGQRVRLSGVAFLWYRLYEPDGTLRLSRTVRRITPPVEIDLRGAAAQGDLWGSTNGVE